MKVDAANRLVVRAYLSSGEQPHNGPVITTRAFPERTLVIAKDPVGFVVWAFYFTAAHPNRLLKIDGAYLIGVERMEERAAARNSAQ